MFSASGSRSADLASSHDAPETVRRASVRPALDRLVGAARSVALALALVALVPSVAHADPTPNEAKAQELFDEGRALMDQGQAVAACEKFEASDKLDPRAGTLLNLGKCFEALGRTASANDAYQRAIAVGKQTGQARHVAAAEEFIAALSPKLSRLTVVVDARAPGLVVTRATGAGGAAVTISEADRGVAVPIDPGDVVIEAHAPDREPWKQTVTLGPEGDAKEVRVPELVENVRRPPPPPKKPPAATGIGPLRTAAFATGGAGIVLVGVGATLGGLTLADAATAQNDPTLCPRKRCTAKGEELVESARAKGVASTTMLAVGGVAVAASVTLFVLSLKEGSKPSGRSQSSLIVAPLLPSPGGSSPIGAIIGGSL
jgi:hypothetical protein